MIGSLRGKIVQKQPPRLLVEVSGVGYEIEAPMSTFYQLSEDQRDVFLFTHLVVREDAHLLYGFISDQERGLFRSLIKVNNVGPKLALAILSALNTDEFVRCVHDNDVNSLVRVPGVGKKTAERLLIEMRDRLDGYEPIGGVTFSDKTSQSNAMQDAISALVSLGYKPQQASQAIAKISDQTLPSETLIRLALQQMT